MTISDENKLIKNIKEYYKSYGAKKTILNFEDDILKLNNPLLSYWFARNIKGANIKAHEQVVLASKDPEYCCWFACYIKGSNIKALKQVVLEHNKFDLWCDYARNVKGEKKAIKKYTEEAKELDIKRLIKSLKEK